MPKNFTLLVLLLALLQAYTAQTDILQSCWNKQVNPAKYNYLHLSYTEKVNQLYHSPEPWLQLNYEGKGIIGCNPTTFFKQDTLTRGKRTFFSKGQYNDSAYFYLDYGSKELSPVTKTMFTERYLLSLRYTPMQLIDLALREKFKVGKQSDRIHVVYEGSINKINLQVFVRRSDSLLGKISLLMDDDLYGDVSEHYTYNDYQKVAEIFYPQTIAISKKNAKVFDTVKITGAKFIDQAPFTIEKPAGYQMKDDVVEKPDLKIEKYSDHIYFMDLKHASTRVMLVEFKDFFLVAEAPLNSKNGELIIEEARKIAPGKPVRYFVFGHHHPHYLGGVRAFVHKGAKILAVPSNKEYVNYLVDARHTLNPDSLQLQPKRLQLELVNDSLTITDGTYTMKIHFLGEKSGHTKDCLVYYFPEEKMLFEDDLVWIKSNGEIKKANDMQVGLYTMVKERKLEVKTIVQSWGISSENYKTYIPFPDLEASINAK